MANKSIKALQNLSQDELKSKFRELEASLFDAKMKRVTGQLEDTSTLWKIRKNLARIKMLQGQAAARK